MADVKTIAISVILALGVVGGAFVFAPNKVYYYCESKPALGVLACDSLSAYYGLPNGKCNNKEQGNRLCSTGWLKVTNDLIIPDDTIIEKNTTIEGSSYNCYPPPAGCQIEG